MAAPDEKNRLRERFARYSLSELEDVLTHLDRDEFPDREGMVIAEIESRLASVEGAIQATTPEEIPPWPGMLRRWASALVDFSIQITIPYVVLYFIVKVIYAPLGENRMIQYLFPPDSPGQGSGGRRGARGANDIVSDISGAWDGLVGFVTGVWSGDSVARSTLVVVGEYFVFYFLYRLIWTGWRLIKSGETSGMQELGIKLCRAGGGYPSAMRVVTRLILQHVLFISTLGLSGLWMVWDKEKSALHDRLAGTRLVRVFRSWEKSPEDRKFD
jgi:uncharacterized RDD family membrane protein YckC